MSNTIEIPAGWVDVVFGDVCTIRNGYAFKSKDFISSGVPLIKQGNLTGTYVNLTNCAFLPEDYLAEFERYQVVKGDILLGMSGSIGEPSDYRHSEPALQNQRTGLLCPSAAVDLAFVRFFLEHAHSQLLDRSKGMAIQNVSAKDIQAIPLGLPPLDEQHRIVENIETLFTRLDKGEEAVREVQKLLTRYRQSVLKSAVTGQLVKSDRSGWEAVELGSLLDDIRYGTAKKCSYETANTAVLRIPNVVGGEISTDDLKYTDLAERDAKNLALEIGDILIVRSNGSANLVARGAVVTEDAVGMSFAGYLIRLRVNQDRILPEYLHLSMSSPQTRALIERQARSTSGVHNINSGEIKAIAVELPSIDEQRQIIAAVDDAFQKIVDLERWCETELKRSASLRQSILKDAFAGRLVPQDPADEPANELLARIRATADDKAAAKKWRKVRA